MRGKPTNFFKQGIKAERSVNHPIGKFLIMGGIRVRVPRKPQTFQCNQERRSELKRRRKDMAVLLCSRVTKIEQHEQMKPNSSQSLITKADGSISIHLPTSRAASSTTGLNLDLARRQTSGTDVTWLDPLMLTKATKESRLGSLVRLMEAILLNIKYLGSDDAPDMQMERGEGRRRN